jgi:hypothetical protein
MKTINKKAAFLGITCLLVIFGISFYSCVKDAGKLPVPVSLSFCDSIDTKFSTVQLPMFQTYCAISGCHDGTATTTAPWNFNLYSDVKIVADNGRIRERVITTKDMPPFGYPSLPDSLVKKLNCWLNKGAQNN